MLSLETAFTSCAPTAAVSKVVIKKHFSEWQRDNVTMSQASFSQSDGQENHQQKDDERIERRASQLLIPESGTVVRFISDKTPGEISSNIYRRASVRDVSF